MKKNRTNGHKEEINLIENVDYFNMADGLYLSVDALTRKYGIGKSTVYHKAREHNLEVKKIAGVACYLDGNAFEKKERVYNTSHLKPLTSYAALVNIVKEMDTKIDKLLYYLEINNPNNGEIKEITSYNALSENDL